MHPKTGWTSRIKKSNTEKTPLLGQATSGGLKMACSSLVVCLIFWTALQFETQPVILAALENASNGVVYPVKSIQEFISSYSNWHESEQSRSRRSMRHIPVIDSHELSATISYAQGLVSKSERHETSISNAGVHVQQGTPAQGQFVDSFPETGALSLAKDALIVAKASQYFSNKHCLRLKIGPEECARQIAELSLSTTPLGRRCSAQYTNLFCSDQYKYRSFDGSCNHRMHPGWGRANTAYRRLIAADYDDGIFTPRGLTRGQEFPSARLLSTSLFYDEDRPDYTRTLAVVHWGQFIAHDLAFTGVSKMLNLDKTVSCCQESGATLSPRHIHSSCIPISVPKDDPFYSKHGQTCMNYVRSLNSMRADCHFGPAEQMNQATHLLDGSMLYGTSQEKAKALRQMSGGKMKTQIDMDGHEYLPVFTPDKKMERCQISRNSSTCYESGDTRVNSQPQLTLMHTLWLREHNRLAEQLSILNPHWNDETVYQEARRIVISQMQHITYSEWLPVILGRKYTSRRGLALLSTGYSNLYDEDVDPSISNAFGNAAMNFLDSMTEGVVGLYSEDRITNATFALKSHFYKPAVVQQDDNFDHLIRGLATQSSQKMDLKYSTAMTQYLFSDSMAFGMDALSLAIQRGRDHGLPGYNQYRKFCGLPEAHSFTDLEENIPKSIVQKLKSLYKSVDDIDLLVGGIAEKPADESLVGPTFRCVMGEQFIRTRIGDRFFYDNPSQPNSYREERLHQIRKASLARIFCDNSDNITMMQMNVFLRPSTTDNDLMPCSEEIIPKINLEAWREQHVKLNRHMS
nr:PREDICTED: peroxidase-like isoform X2 [Bemisia tabaci]